MFRRPNASRRLADGDSLPFIDAFRPKVRRSPLLIGAAVMAALLIAFLYHHSGSSKSDLAAAISKYGRISCTQELPSLIPLLKKAYGGSMHKVLHIGPESCSIVSQLVENDADTEAWGIEPYELDDAGTNCRSLVQKGVVRVADIKLPLPYRKKSFSLVIVSDAVDYLSPKYLNRTVPELARVSTDGFIVLSGYPISKKVKPVDLPKFGRPAKYRTSSWWIRFFFQANLEENEAASKKFELAAAKKSYRPSCQVFHLKSLL